jgi:hypothetical protein
MKKFPTTGTADVVRANSPTFSGTVNVGDAARYNRSC